MPDNQSINFESADRPRSQATLDRAFTLTVKAYLDATQSVPTSATVDVKRPGGAPLPTAVSGSAVTIDGAGTMTYAVVAGNTNLLGANYSAVWHAVISGVTYDFVQLFDVVRFPLRNMVRQADLLEHHPDLTDLLPASEANFQVYCERAFMRVYQWLDSKGRRPYLVLSSEDLRLPIEHKALELIFRPRSREDGDRWWSLAEHHATEYDKTLSAMSIVYDEDQSGTADGTAGYEKAGEERSIAAAAWKI